MVDPALRERVRQLTPEDRLDLIADLWESLDTEAIEVTDAEKRLLDERIDDLEQNPDDERPFDDFMADLRARL
jgi:putative addiction module component (TIGR02574 family)